MKILKILLGLGLILVLFVGGIFYITSDLAESADDFFAMVKQGHLQKAYDGLSQGFKNNTSFEKFKMFLESKSLLSVNETSWTSRSFENSSGKIEGSVTTEDGGTVPLKISLVKEAGAWKIHGITTSPVGVPQPQEAGPPATVVLEMPSNDKLVELTRETTSVFGKAVDTKDMSLFRNYISKLWQNQYSVEQLEEAYSSLYKLGAKWASLDNLSPIFHKPPEQDNNGVIIISGYYPTKPDLLTFQYKYIPEGTEWKLLGLSVKLVPPDKLLPTAR